MRGDGGGVSQTRPLCPAHIDPGGDEARPGPDRSLQHPLETPPPSAAAGPSRCGPGAWRSPRSSRASRSCSPRRQGRVKRAWFGSGTSRAVNRLATLSGLPLPNANAGRPGLVIAAGAPAPAKSTSPSPGATAACASGMSPRSRPRSTESSDGSLNVAIGWSGPDGLITASYERREPAVEDLDRQANGGLGVEHGPRFPAAKDGRADVPRAMALFGPPPAALQQAAILLARLPLSPTGRSVPPPDRLCPRAAPLDAGADRHLGKRHPR